MKSKNFYFTLMGLFVPLFTFSDEYFIKPGTTDTGNDGSTWENAITINEFYKGVAASLFKDGDTFYFAGGTYYPTLLANSDAAELTNNFTFIGGFDPSSKGTAKEMPTYPSATPTIFSGDLNNNNIPDEGDAGNLLHIYIQSQEKERQFRIIGIDFTNSYGNATNYKAGALWVGRSNVLVKNCRFYNNTARENGGGATMLHGAKFHFIDCEFTNNKALALGGAARTSNNKTWGAYGIFERCLFANNEATGGSGGAIAGSSMKEIWIVNTTIVDNKAVHTGGGVTCNGSTTTSDDLRKVFIVSSTIASNECTGDPDENNFNGTQIRFAQEPYVKLYNNIIVAKNDEGTIRNSALALTGKEKTVFELVSDGYNLFGGFAIEAEAPINVPVWSTSDNVSKENTYATVFGSNVLKDNGGIYKTLALKEQVEGAWVEELQDVLKNWGASEDIDYTVDQRGYKRNPEGPSIGAMDIAGIASAISTVAADKGKSSLLSLGQNCYRIAGAEKEAAIYNLSGALIKRCSAERIDLTMMANGIYFIKAGNKAYKIVK